MSSVGLVMSWIPACMEWVHYQVERLNPGFAYFFLALLKGFWMLLGCFSIFLGFLGKSNRLFSLPRAGEKDKLEFAPGPEAYHSVHSTYHPKCANLGDLSPF